MESKPEQPRVQRPSSPPTSGPAIAATAALVLFSVFIGVYGPRLGNRQQIPAGTTLPELAAALQPKHTLRVVETRSQGTNLPWARPERSATIPDDPSTRDAESIDTQAAAGAEMVGSPLVLPKLGAYRVRWEGPDRVRMPGGAGALYFLTAQRVSDRRGESLHASLLILEDEDRFTVFDRFARPQPMPEGEVFSVATTNASAGTGGGGAGLVYTFRAGNLVFAVQSTDEGLAEDLVAELELGAAQAARSRH